MVKGRLTVGVPYTTLELLDIISKNIMKSKAWIVENALHTFAKQVDGYLSVNEDIRGFIEIKKDMWKDDLKDEILRHNLKKGFMLKNSIKKILQMVEYNVDKSYIYQAISMYRKLCTNKEYSEILTILEDDLRKGEVNIVQMRERIEGLGRAELTTIYQR